MSSLSELSQELKITLEEIAKLVSAGTDVQNIARKTNLDVPTIDGFMGRDEFHAIFRLLDEKAYQRWVDDQGDLTARRAVKNMARADVMEHYKLYRDAVRAGEGLKDNEKLNHLWNLIKLGGALDDVDVVERVTLSEGSAELMRETLQELDGFFRK